MKVLVIVSRRYNGHELWTTLGVLQEAKIEFEVVATTKVIADEVSGQVNSNERTLDDIDPNEMGDVFQGLLVVSGFTSDTMLHWNHKKVQAIVERVAELRLPIGAICVSVPTIRKAVNGKTVSCYPLVQSKELLRQAGANISSISISVDNNVVTAEHQMNTQMWAETFVKVCKGETPKLDLQDSHYTPMGHTERRLHPLLERARGSKLHPKNEVYFDYDQ